MIYVFEDDARDPLPQLFMSSYPNNIASKFIYTRGNGNIYKTVEKLVSGQDDIVVYLDTIPGNDSTHRIYQKLVRLSKKNNRKVIVLPIIGLEYYFIRSIQHEKCVLSSIEVGRCVSRKEYFNSGLLLGQREKEYCNSYERYCKLILEKSVIDCIRNSRDNGNNKLFRWFYSKDCRCKLHLETCRDRTICDKSKAFLSEFPCIPVGSIHKNKGLLSLQDIWKIHKDLVDEHNVLCRELKMADPDQARKNAYKEIKVI